MPVEKNVTKLIPRIYKCNAENLGLFFFIKGQQTLVPAIRVEQAIYNYFNFTGIEDWDFESARTTYDRLQRDYIDYQYIDKLEKKHGLAKTNK